jgi:hypothetical protein
VRAGRQAAAGSRWAGCSVPFGATFGHRCSAIVFSLDIARCVARRRFSRLEYGDADQGKTDRYRTASFMDRQRHSARELPGAFRLPTPILLFAC